MAKVQEPEIVEREVAPMLPMKVGGTIDVQVATARAYPRSIAKFIQTAQELATLTPEIAASCVYALPRGGKTIEGPSARLAEIIAHAWGNLRIQAGATEHDDRYITARGEAWDVESNTAIGFEVRRRITKSNGQTYDDDMITVTGNAAASIALRNAVFKAVPSSFWRPIYLKCRQVVAGDAKTFASRRDDMIKAFMVAGVTPERLCAGIGLRGVADMTLEHMATLVGVLNALKDGDTTIEDAFPDGGGMQLPQPAQRKSQQNGGGAAPAGPQTGGNGASEAPNTKAPAAPASVQSEPPAQTPANERVGVIVKVDEQGKNAVLVLNTAFRCATNQPAFIAAAKGLKESAAVVELVTHASRTPGNLPVLDEIQSVEAE